jgi:hypothetical protein
MTTTAKLSTAAAAAGAGAHRISLERLNAVLFRARLRRDGRPPDYPPLALDAGAVALLRWRAQKWQPARVVRWMPCGVVLFVLALGCIPTLFFGENLGALSQAAQATLILGFGFVLPGLLLLIERTVGPARDILHALTRVADVPQLASLEKAFLEHPACNAYGSAVCQMRGLVYADFCHMASLLMAHEKSPGVEERTGLENRSRF